MSGLTHRLIARAMVELKAVGSTTANVPGLTEVRILVNPTPWDDVFTAPLADIGPEGELYEELYRILQTSQP